MTMTINDVCKFTFPRRMRHLYHDLRVHSRSMAFRFPYDVIQGRVPHPCAEMRLGSSQAHAKTDADVDGPATRFVESVAPEMWPVALSCRPSW